MKKLFAVRSYAADVDAAFLILRIITGLAFIFHGLGKIQNPLAWMGPDSPVPGILQALAALSEFGGGIALILGLLTRLASFGLVCTMIVAVFTHAVKMGDPFVASGGGRSYELAAIYFAITLLFMIAGPGRYSADRKIFGPRN